MAQYQDLLDAIRNGTTDQSVSDDSSVQSNIMSQGGRTAGEARANARMLAQDSDFSQGAAQAQTSAFNSTAKARADRIAAQAAPAAAPATAETKTTATGAAAGTMSQFSAAANSATTPSTTSAPQPKPVATATSTSPATYTNQSQQPTGASTTATNPNSNKSPSSATSTNAPAKPSNYNALVNAAQGFGQDTRDPRVQQSMAAAQSELLRSGFNANGTYGTTSAGAPQQVVPGNASTGTPISYAPSGNAVHNGGVVRAQPQNYASNFNQLLSNIMQGGVVQGAPRSAGNAGYTSAGTSTYGQYNPGGYTTPGMSQSVMPSQPGPGNSNSQYGPSTGIVPPGGAPTATTPAQDPDVNPFQDNPNSYAYQQWEQSKRNAANSANYANTAAQQKAQLDALSQKQNAANLARLAKQNQATAADRAKLAKANNAMEARQGSKAQQMAATNQTTSNPQYAALLKSLLGYR